MKIPENRRLRGEFDPVDLVAGIIIAAGIPLLAFFIFANFGEAVQAPTPKQMAEDSKKIRARADAEYIQLKMEYVKKIYNETGKEFMRRSQQSRGVQRMNEEEWAEKWFRSLISELRSLENEIKSDAVLSGRFSGRLVDIGNLKYQIQADLLAIAQ